MNDNIIDIASQCVEKSLKNGGDQADCVIFDSFDLMVRWRLGKSETIEKSDSRGLGLRVFVESKDGLKQAIVSTNDFSEDIIDTLVTRAVDMAKVAPADPYAGLADKALLATDFPDLDICDSKTVDAKKLQEWAAEAEEAALSIEGVTNSEGAEASCGTGSAVLATSTGFINEFKSTSFSLAASVVAGEGTNMETDYEYSVGRHIKDLEKPEILGKKAGQFTVDKLNPKKVETCKVPLIFDPRTARSLMGALSGAINGSAIAKDISFLKDKMGEQIFAKGVMVYDDPLMIRGMGTESFDAEGVQGEKRAIIENGVLTGWLLDSYSAKKLGLQSTGNASRGISSSPSPTSTNFYLGAGEFTSDELMSDIKDGFYVMEAFGMGVNNVTGDYSQGASGFWIENGKITYPVSEITIAGNLNDMFKNMTPANDLEMLFSTNSPTVRIEGMTVAGV